jgi:choline dehydrogenase-like flavoprotein
MQIEDAFVKACNDSMSVSAPADAWSGDHIGFTTGLGAISREPGKRGKRSYAVNYLEGRSSTNLKVLCEAHVNRINLEGIKATGANFTFDGSEFDVIAGNEVIVCGGVVKSPQILELSGIGDPEILKNAGVELKVANKGVGANVQDHAATALCVELKPDGFSIDSFGSKPELAQAAIGQYMTSGTGIFSNVFAVTGFIPFKTLVSDVEFEDALSSIGSIEPSSDFHKRQLGEIEKQLRSETSANIQVALFPVTWSPEFLVEHQSNKPTRTEGAGISIVVCTEYPASRGTIHIHSSGTALTAPACVRC